MRKHSKELEAAAFSLIVSYRLPGHAIHMGEKLDAALARHGVNLGQPNCRFHHLDLAEERRDSCAENQFLLTLGHDRALQGASQDLIRHRQLTVLPSFSQ